MAASSLKLYLLEYIFGQQNYKPGFSCKLSRSWKKSLSWLFHNCFSYVIWKWVNGVDQYSKHVWLEDRPGWAKLSKKKKKWCFFMITFLATMKFYIVHLRLKILHKLQTNPGSFISQKSISVPLSFIFHLTHSTWNYFYNFFTFSFMINLKDF